MPGKLFSGLGFDGLGFEVLLTDLGMERGMDEAVGVAGADETGSHYDSELSLNHS